MKRSTTRVLEFCMMCIGHAVIGGMFLILGWAFTMMFCHFFAPYRVYAQEGRYTVVTNAYGIETSLDASIEVTVK